MATALWRRLQVVYQQWPWRLAALQDTRLTDAEKTEICQEFFSALDCCLDRGCAKPLQGILNEPSDLRHKFDAVTKSISVTKVVNSQIENNFARACSAARCARGVLVHSHSYPPLSLLSYNSALAHAKTHQTGLKQKMHHRYRNGRY